MTLDIAIISHLINTHSGARAPLELAGYLSRKNKVTFYAFSQMQDKKLIQKLRNKNLKFTRMPYKNTTLINKFKNTLYLSHLLKKRKHDVISSHCLLPLFFGLFFTKTPVISTYYGTQKNAYLEKIFPKDPNYFQKILNLIANQVIYFNQWIILNLSTKSIAISIFTQKEAKKNYRKNLEIITLGKNNLC